MPTKIIHIVLGKANPDRMNGVNKVAHNQASALFKLGCDVEIWGITKTPSDEIYPRAFPTRLFKMQSFFRDLDPKIMTALRELPQNSIVHIHGAFISDFYKVSRLLMDMKIPYVYTPHGAYNRVALKKSKWIKKLYIERYEKSMLRDAIKVQFLGQSEFDHIAKIVKLKNKTIIPNGQNFDEVGFDFHRMKTKSHPIFGFCGRLDVYYKGLDVLIDGFSLYCNKGGEGELWLIGDGPDRPKLEAQVVAHNLQERVVFMGARYGKDKLNRIANMDVFCHPSRSEGSPTAVLEAAALKRPLLVSTATNVGHIVEERGCGIHISATTAKAVEKGLFIFEKKYNSNEHLTMGESSFRMVKEEFRWERIAEKLLEVYNEVAA
jgi:glycosyltransferase involved in cell wall biosynthesis